MIVVVVVVIAVMNINSIAKTAVETGGTAALGVPTTLEGAHIGLFSGKVGLDKLNIANPEGFKTAHLLNVQKFRVEVSLGSLMSDTVDIPLIELDGASMNIEQQGNKSNMKVISDNVSGGETAPDTKEPKEPTTPAEGGGKKFKVGKLIIRNISARIELVDVPLLKGATSVPVKIPEIVIDDLTSDNANGVAMDELTKRIIPILMTAVLEKAGGAIDPEVLKGLTGDLGSLVGNLGKGATEAIGKVGGEIANKAGEAAEKVIGDVGKGIEKGVKDIGKGIGEIGKGLLGGDKDKKDDSNTDEKKDDNPLKGIGDGLNGLLGGDKKK